MHFFWGRFDLAFSAILRPPPARGVRAREPRSDQSRIVAREQARIVTDHFVRVGPLAHERWALARRCGTAWKIA